MDYGLGAIFGCPAHDQRDLDFAKEYNLEIVSVVKPANHDNEGFKINNTAFTDDGIVINSDKLNGLTTKDAKEQIIRILEKENIGKKKSIIN